MSPKEKEVLTDALHTLDGVVLDYYNYNKPERYNFECLGRQMLARRALAELIGMNINDYLLPGESTIEDEWDKENSVRFTVASISDALTLKEKIFLNETVLTMVDNLIGVGDSDDACLRTLRRRIAEVAGYPDLGKYRLLYSQGNAPIYFKDYQSYKSSEE